MDLTKSARLKKPYSKILQPFADIAGANVDELVNELFAKHIVTDFSFHEQGDIECVLKYFEHKVIPHKIAVYQAGVELAEADWFMDVCSWKEEFLRNLVRHDLSKFSAAEGFGYALYNFKDPRPETKTGFESAWHHHKMNNPHHPEYWLNPNRSGKLEIMAMPPLYILEMLADWIGASSTYGTTLEKWIPGNLHKFIFHPSILDLLQQLLLKLGIEAYKNERGLFTTID